MRACPLNNNIVWHFKIKVSRILCNLAAFFQGVMLKCLHDRRDRLREEEPKTLACQTPWARGLTTTWDEFSVNLGNFIFDSNSSSLRIYVISSGCQAIASSPHWVVFWWVRWRKSHEITAKFHMQNAKQRNIVAPAIKVLLVQLFSNMRLKT